MPNENSNWKDNAIGVVGLLFLAGLFGGGYFVGKRTNKPPPTPTELNERMTELDLKFKSELEKILKDNSDPNIKNLENRITEGDRYFENRDYGSALVVYSDVVSSANNIIKKARESDRDISDFVIVQHYALTKNRLAEVGGKITHLKTLDKVGRR